MLRPLSSAKIIKQNRRKKTLTIRSVRFRTHLLFPIFELNIAKSYNCALLPSKRKKKGNESTRGALSSPKTKGWKNANEKFLGV